MMVSCVASRAAEVQLDMPPGMTARAICAPTSSAPSILSTDWAFARLELIEPREQMRQQNRGGRTSASSLTFMTPFRTKKYSMSCISRSARR